VPAQIGRDVMIEPDPAEVRAVLREHGYEVPDRGRINAANMARYRELVNTPGSDGEPEPPMDLGEYDAGVTEADFPPEEPPAPGPENKPRRVRASRKTGWRDRLAGGPVKKKGKRPARVPVDRLIERGWEILARLAEPVSLPISRCLAWQSPVAGMIWEDVIKDTVADRALQPIARAEEKAEKVVALVGPPVLVGAIQAAQGLPEDQRALRLAILVPMLRESLVIGVKVMGDKLEERQTRELEMGPINARIDEIMAGFFAPPPAPPPAPEDEQAAQAQAMAGV
jgi:hypothetical protein